MKEDMVQKVEPPSSTSAHVITYRSAVRTPMQLLRDMVYDARAARYVAWRILVRDLSARYRQTALGFLWAFIPPLAVAGALSVASGSRVLQVGPTPIPYLAYVVFGVVLWQAFSEAATSPIQAVSEARSMLTKINFPREALVIAKGGDVLVNFVVKALLVGAVFVWYGVPVYWTALLAPFALLAMVLLGLAIGTMLAPIGAIYQDAPRVLSVALSFWFFLTPVAYPLPTEGLFSTLVNLNPVTPLMVAIRDLTNLGQLSMPLEFYAVAMLSVVLFVIAWVLFRLTMPYVIERMGS